MGSVYFAHACYSILKGSSNEVLCGSTAQEGKLVGCCRCPCGALNEQDCDMRRVLGRVRDLTSWTSRRQPLPAEPTLTSGDGRAYCSDSPSVGAMYVWRETNGFTSVNGDDGFA